MVPVWYKIIVENNVLTLACIPYQRLKLTTKPIVLGEPEWCLMGQKIINFLINKILSILFSIAVGEWPTVMAHHVIVS